MKPTHAHTIITTALTAALIIHFLGHLGHLP